MQWEVTSRAKYYKKMFFKVLFDLPLAETNTSLTSCSYRIFLFRISCISACSIFSFSKQSSLNSCGHEVNRTYMILTPKDLWCAFPDEPYQLLFFERLKVTWMLTWYDDSVQTSGEAFTVFSRNPRTMTHSMMRPLKSRTAVRTRPRFTWNQERSQNNF